MYYFTIDCLNKLHKTFCATFCLGNCDLLSVNYKSQLESKRLIFLILCFLLQFCHRMQITSFFHGKCVAFSVHLD